MKECAAPDLRRATPIHHLVKALGRACPLQVALDEEFPLTEVSAADLGIDIPEAAERTLRRTGLKLDLWKLPVGLPPGRRGNRYANLPVDLTPLFELHDRHQQSLGSPVRWTYEYYYFELLAKERRIVPAFWVRRGGWDGLRRTYERYLGDIVTPHAAELQKQWQDWWERLLAAQLVQWDTPSNWLDMLEVDEEIAQLGGTVAESIWFAMIPVYQDVGPQDVRQCMVEDMVRALVFIPKTHDDAVSRWEGFARRLGLTNRWPSRDAFLAEIRERTVLILVGEGLTPTEIGDRLVELELFPIRKKGRQQQYDKDSPRRTAYAIIDRLIRQGLLNDRDVARRPPGRPRKEQREPGADNGA